MGFIEVLSAKATAQILPPFHFENDDIMVVALDNREDIYRKWQ